MKHHPNYLSILIIFVFALTSYAQTNVDNYKLAEKPLFRDNIYDGAADPIVRWNKSEGKWFMFYTNRRANIESTNGVDWVHGTPIGIAESADGGATWKYRADAKINYGEKDYSYWAPDIVEHDGLYHMFLTVVPGTFDTWNHPRDIVHLTSRDMLEWDPVSELKLANNKVIDAGVYRQPNGKWIMYYNNEKDGKSIYYAESNDLYNWTDQGKLIGDFPPGEGPMIFRWKDKYFMVVDHWKGLGIYSSEDMINWKRQPERILETPGKGLDDTNMANHADVVVNGDKAYIFYFVHPARPLNSTGVEFRRSSVQVAELEYNNGVITCNRDKAVYINLKTQ